MSAGQNRSLRDLLPPDQQDIWAPTIFAVKGVLVGAANTGKTNIIERLTNGRFNPARVSTESYDIVETYVEIGYKGLAAQVRLWDTAGQERHRHRFPLFYQNAYICFIVYDITDRSSFDAVAGWWQHCKNEEPPCVTEFPTRPNVALVGNKTDLDHLREVSSAEGEELARTLGIPYFIEQSSTALQAANDLDYMLVIMMHRVMNIKTVETIKKRSSNYIKTTDTAPPETPERGSSTIVLGVTPSIKAASTSEDSCAC